MIILRLIYLHDGPSPEELLKKTKTQNIESSNNIRSIDLDMPDINKYLNPLQLITSKPVLYVCNVDENSINSTNNHVESVKSLINKEGANLIVLAAGIESEINELDDYEERRMFLDDLGLDIPGSSKLINATYDLLNLLQVQKKCVLGLFLKWQLHLKLPVLFTQTLKRVLLRLKLLIIMTMLITKLRLRLRRQER